MAGTSAGTSAGWEKRRAAQNNTTVKPTDSIAPKQKKPRARKAGKVTRELAGGVAMFIALPFQFLMPADAFSQVEVQALSVALYDAAAANETIRQILLNVAGVGGVGELVGVVGCIAGKRVVKRAKLQPQGEPMRQMVTGVMDGLLMTIAAKGAKESADEQMKQEITPAQPVQASDNHASEPEISEA